MKGFAVRSRRCRRRFRSWNVDTDRFRMDHYAFEICGIPDRTQVTFEDLSSRIHPTAITSRSTATTEDMAREFDGAELGA